eukprot:338819-Chlamydomonas_euryale.AAC.1
MGCSAQCRLRLPHSWALPTAHPAVQLSVPAVTRARLPSLPSCRCCWTSLRAASCSPVRRRPAAAFAGSAPAESAVAAAAARVSRAARQERPVRDWSIRLSTAGRLARRATGAAALAAAAAAARRSFASRGSFRDTWRPPYAR